MPFARAVTAVSSVDPNAPFVAFVEQAVAQLHKQALVQAARVVPTEQLSAQVQADRFAAATSLAASVPLSCADEVGQMASAFNAMQAGYQRVVNTVARTARQLDEGAARLASSMNEVQHGMLGQQSETDQAATAINEMSATVHHIAQYTAETRDQSKNADQLAGDGQAAVSRVSQSIAGLSAGVQQTAEMIQRLATDPHSPAEFRCNQVVKNIDIYYEAFDVSESDEMYLAPKDRVVIW